MTGRREKFGRIFIRLQRYRMRGANGQRKEGVEYTRTVVWETVVCL